MTIGAFFHFLQVQGASEAEVRHAWAQAVGRSAAFAPAGREWVGVYPRSTDVADLETLASDLSASLSRPVLAFDLHDSSVLSYWLYESGALADRYASSPEYFAPIDPREVASLRGNPGRLAELSGVEAGAAELRTLLDRQPTYAEELLAELAAALGIDPAMATGFDHLPEAVTEEPSRRISGGARTKLGQDLLAAAFQGNTGGVRSALDLGAEVSHSDPDGGNTALHFAAGGNHAALIGLLLAEGAQIDQTNELGYSPLMMAISSQAGEATTTLLERGADPNHRDLQGFTPLMFAATQQDTGTIARLLAAGADPARRSDRQGLTAAALAERKGAQHIVEILAAGGEPSGRSTALFRAVREGDVMAVHLQLEGGAPIDDRDPRGATLLLTAVGLGSPELVPELLRRGADPNLALLQPVPEGDWGPEWLAGTTPLLIAAASGDGTMCRLLLESGASLEPHDDSGLDALMAAAAGGHSAVVELLLDTGADPERRDVSGWRAEDYVPDELPELAARLREIR